MADAINGASRSARIDFATEQRLKRLAESNESRKELRSDDAQATPPAKDEVKLSGIAAKAASGPDFDRDKVESIKRAIEEGNYPLDSRRIAESFVALEKII